MPREKNPMLEASEALKSYREESEQKRKKKIAEAAQEREAIDNKLMSAKDNRELKYESYSSYVEDVKDSLLASAIRGIYVGAIMENTYLTEDGLNLCMNLVDNYITENGGASTILRKIGGKTYTLDLIKSLVEDTAEEITADADPENPESQDIPEDKENEVVDKMSDDDDINNAVQIIAQRVTDAEEEFIKKNNEDKQALEDITNKMTERINAVEDDPNATPEEKEEAEEEATRITKRYENELRSKRTRSVFEQVVLNLSESILKDEELRDTYYEDGKLDMPMVIESAKCIYGLLETVNTLQLQTVTPEYIQEALSTM